MLLVDTSVWVDHFRRHDATLAELLEGGEAVCHPFVIGELACGNLHNRAEILTLLAAMPTVPKADEEEALLFIERRGLAGRGLGLIDMHLLASSALADVTLWTRDTRLAQTAAELGLDVNG